MGYTGPRMDQVKFFKNFLPQFLLGPLLDILSHIMWSESVDYNYYYYLMLHKWKPY